MSEQTAYKKEERFWIALLAILPAIIVVASLSRSLGLPASIITFNEKWLTSICHTDADRCFVIFDLPMIICSRCTGIYSALFVGISCSFFISFSIRSRRVPMLMLGTALLIIVVDVLGNYANWWVNSTISRFLTGSFFGISLSLFFNVNKVKRSSNHGTET